MKIYRLLKLKQYLFACFCCWLICIPYGYNWSQSVKSITAEHGLPQSFVSGIVQDRNDFVWVSTRNGLARFDGNNFRMFRNDVFDTTTLAANLTTHLQQFNNKLWIEYDEGLIDCFDPDSEYVRHIVSNKDKDRQQFRFIRRSWIVDKAERLWGIDENGNVFGYNPTTRTIDFRPFSGTTGSKGIALALNYDRKADLLWILNEKGVTKLDLKSGTSVHFNSPYPLSLAKGQQDALRLQVALHRRNNGELIWGVADKLYSYNPSENRFYQLFTFSFKSNDGFRLFAMDREGNDYFEQNGSVYRINKQNKTESIFQGVNEAALPIQSFLIDQSNLIWLGTNAHGIVQIDLNAPGFSAIYNNNSFAEDVLKLLHIPMSAAFNWLSSDKRFTAPGYHLRSIYDSGHEHLWIGLKERVLCYNVASGKIKTYPRVPSIGEDSGSGIGIKGIALSGQNIPLVVGYNGNILEYNEAGAVWLPLIPHGTVRKIFGADITIRDMLADKDYIWMSTDQDGLLRLNRNTKSLQNIRAGKEADALPTDRLLALHQDKKNPNLIWIGSYSGLIALDKLNLKTKVYNESKGLPDNTVYSIQSDRNGNIWFSTNKGLVRLNPEQDQLSIFQSMHGLPDDEFNRFHHFMLPDGSMIFGGTKGWVKFMPESIKEDSFQPKVAITELKIFNEHITARSHPKLLSAPINTLQTLYLEHDQNTITISFAGLQYNQPKDIRYRYQLKGYDKEWVMSEKIGFASYTKLPPGHYEFMVNCSNSSGLWSQYFKKIHIIVSPPWWRTWWAYSLWSILIGGALWYLIQLQTARIKLKQSIALKEHEAQQMQALNDIKTRFFTNVAHDFRTPLTLILTPARSLAQNVRDEVVLRQIQIIGRNAEKMLILINQLLDLSKMEANSLQLENVQDYLSTFVEEHIKAFESEAERKNITLSYCSEIEGMYSFDPGKIKSILDNLLGNALKFTPEEGRVVLELSVGANGFVQIRISDSGIGIAEQDLPHIFERYFQGASRLWSGMQGSGIGLAMVRELVALLNGSVSVSSERGKGTSFVILLPLEKVITTEIQTSSSDFEKKIQTDDINDQKVSVLIVEDNTELAQFLSDCLSETYHIMRADNGISGLKLAVRELPDIIISDVMMPEMDGMELCRQLKATEETAHIPVIMLTAKSEQENKMSALSLGADEYLNKPFYTDELLLKINNLLKRRQQWQKYFQEHSTQIGSENKKETDPFLKKIYLLVEENLGDSKLGVEAIAEKMFMSRVQLYRKVKALTGITVTDLVRNYRLGRAVDFLKEGLSSSEAAYRSGFDSPAYFSKCFKAVYGKTPTDVIKSGNI